MKKKLWFKILINFAAWWVGLMTIISLETFLQYSQNENYKFNIFTDYITLMAFNVAALSVSHYYILYVRFFQRKKYLQYVLGCIAFLILFVLAAAASFHFILGGRDKFLESISVVFMQAALIFTPAAIFYSLIKGNLALLKRKKELENQQLQSSIAVLKSQLDPHFLFNSLNVIYATARNEKANKTSESIEELTGLFRYSLEEAGQEKVSIEKELQFIDKYLHLQKLRIPEGEQIKIVNHIQWDKQPVQIAPMLLLPFIENAYKYGISYQHPSEVNIDIRIENGLAKVNIANTNHADKVQTSSTGIGKENALKRLALQYNGRHEYSEQAEEGMYRVSLTIEL